jgi:hypothetical protein
VLGIENVICGDVGSLWRMIPTQWEMNVSAITMLRKRRVVISTRLTSGKEGLCPHANSIFSNLGQHPTRLLNKLLLSYIECNTIESLNSLKFSRSRNATDTARGVTSRTNIGSWKPTDCSEVEISYEEAEDEVEEMRD